MPGTFSIADEAQPKSPTFRRLSLQHEEEASVLVRSLADEIVKNPEATKRLGRTHPIFTPIWTQIWELAKFVADNEE